MMHAYAERVAKGAALLDKKVPDWASKINMDVLDITDPLRCILGQLFDNFELGVTTVFGDLAAGWDLAPDYGLNLTDAEWDTRWDDEDPADELRDYWSIEIKNRLS